MNKIIELIQQGFDIQFAQGDGRLCITVAKDGYKTDHIMPIEDINNFIDPQSAIEYYLEILEFQLEKFLNDDPLIKNVERNYEGVHRFYKPL